MKKVKKQLAHLFDATQCINCGACTTACAQTNYPDLINEFIPAWNTVCNNIRQVKVEKNRPMQLLVLCQQCSEAPCVTTCPFGANYYDENGLVRNDPKRCIGSNYCVASCPYDARWSNPKTGLFGDTLDPQSEISRKIASSKTQTLLESHGTKPNFYVVVQK